MLPTPSNMQMDENNAQLMEQLRQACLARFDLFASAVLGYQVTPFHAGMVDHQLSTPHSMILAPRGSGKSTIADVAYCIWRILKNPNLRIAIASKSGPQAKGFLGEIKSHFESNTDLIKLFGSQVGKSWNEDEIIVASRNKILKEPTITAIGSGAGIPGRHFDIIIADDLVDLENSSTDHQREKTRMWFYQVLLPTLEPDGELRVIGTRYNPKDLYGHLAFKDKKTGLYADEAIGPHVFCVSAISRNKDTGEEESFWEVKFPLEFLRSLRRRMGTANFNLQMQNDAKVTEGGIIKIEDLENHVWHGEHDCPPLKELTIFQGVDPAIGLKQENDFFAHCTIGVSENRHIYVLEIILQKLTFNEQVDLIIQKYRQWGAEMVGIETIAYQQALAQAVKDKGVWLNIHEVKPRNDKLARAKIFSAYTERHEVHFHFSMIDHMENVAGMPNVDHDDDFDAVDISVDTARQVSLNDSVVAVLPTNFRRR